MSQTDDELLDLLKKSSDVPLPTAGGSDSAIPNAAESAWELDQQEFAASQREYDEEMRLLSQPNDEQEAWKEIARQTGRL